MGSTGANDTSVEDTQDGESANGVSIVPAAQKSSWGSYIKTLMSASGDLANLTAPTFLLSGKSVLEHETAYHLYPEVYADINRGHDAVDRMLKVVRWWLASLWTNFGENFASSQSVKKPFNPILGEQYHCFWEDQNSEWGHVSMIAEQVSHHPPVSAFMFESPKLGMYLNGSILTKTRFRGTAVKVDNVGEVILVLKQHNEEYRITYPEMCLRGIISGKIFFEITGETFIRSSAGITAHVDHIAKGWFMGEYHGIKGSVYYTDQEEPLYYLSGKWTDKTFAEDTRTNEKIPLSVITGATPIHARSKPLEELGELETLKVWRTVSQALKNEDFSRAAVEKNAIEEKQRALRRQRESEKIEWKPKYFHQTPSNEIHDTDVKEKDKISFWTYNGFPKINENEPCK